MTIHTTAQGDGTRGHESSGGCCGLCLGGVWKNKLLCRFRGAGSWTHRAGGQSPLKEKTSLAKEATSLRRGRRPDLPRGRPVPCGGFQPPGRPGLPRGSPSLPATPHGPLLARTAPGASVAVACERSRRVSVLGGNLWAGGRRVTCPLTSAGADGVAGVPAWAPGQPR